MAISCYKKCDKQIVRKVFNFHHEGLASICNENTKFFVAHSEGIYNFALEVYEDGKTLYGVTYGGWKLKPTSINSTFLNKHLDRLVKLYHESKND